MVILLGIIGALALFFGTVMVIDCHRFVIRTYSCSAEKLKKDVKIVLLSDLHNHSFGKDNEKLIGAINRIAPDMIVMAGDMYTSAPKGESRRAWELAGMLAEKYPVYYGNGNHEQKTRMFPEQFGAMYQELADRLKKAKVTHLVNEKVYLPAYNMDIYGLEIDRKYFKKGKTFALEKEELEKKLGKADPDRFSLLIAHNPDYFKTYALWGADLTLSGHVHGGLMRLPWAGGVISPSLRLFPKYDGGKFKEGRAGMILSRGLGTHTLPIRIFNPGELVVIELSRS